MPEQEPKRKRRSRNKSDVFLIPQGETPRAELEREFTISQRIGIDLMKMFESATYQSPSELKKNLEELAGKYGLTEISIKQVGSYLLGILDESDYDSPLRKAFGDSAILRRNEFVARQTLTTMAALVENFGTDIIKGKTNSPQP